MIPWSAVLIVYLWLNIYGKTFVQQKPLKFSQLNLSMYMVSSYNVVIAKNLYKKLNAH